MSKIMCNLCVTNRFINKSFAVSGGIWLPQHFEELQLDKMARVTAIVFYLAIGMIHAFNGDSFELECPDECDCHYFRINWVTDCSESNLTEVPYDELSLSVYILDLNENNITALNTFPTDIKMRRLQIANNRLTRVERQAFLGLEYLIDVDLSGNNISYVDPEAFL